MICPGHLVQPTRTQLVIARSAAAHGAFVEPPGYLDPAAASLLQLDRVAGLATSFPRNSERLWELRLTRTQFPKPVIASEAWQSRRGQGRRYVNEIATSLRSSR